MADSDLGQAVKIAQKDLPLARDLRLFEEIVEMLAETVAAEEDVAQVLLFVIDILREEATLLVPNEFVRNVALNSFGLRAEGDTVVLPWIISRKRQIVPVLAL